MLPKLNIDQAQLLNASELYRALSHPLRLQLIQFIDQNQEINVNKIYTALNLEQSITSQHLRALRLADIVTAQRQGKNIFYQLNYNTLRRLQSAQNDYLKVKHK